MFAWLYESLWFIPSSVVTTIGLIVLACYSFANQRTAIAGRSVLVTGCDRGLGYDVALHLSRMGGVEVFAGCLTQAGCDALSTASESTVHTLLLDVTDVKSIEHAQQIITARCPHGLYALVNNAGIFETYVCELTPLSIYQRVMDVNFFGTVRMIQTFAPLVRRAQGRIVNVGSFLGKSSSWSLSAYAASKHALEALTDSLRAELAPFNVSVSLVRPSAMKTTMIDTVPAMTVKLFQSAPPVTSGEYGADYLKCMPRVTRVLSLLSSPTDGAVNAIEHALTARVPRAHYAVGLESFATSYLLPLVPVPASVIDWLIALIGGLPKPAAMRATAAATDSADKAD